jgi:hypothetical protein
MSNKNAYEIRLDVLSMAHSDLFGKYQQKLDAYRVNTDRKNDVYDVTLVDSLYPKTSDIIARAEELYLFVSQP